MADHPGEDLINLSSGPNSPKQAVTAAAPLSKKNANVAMKSEERSKAPSRASFAEIEQYMRKERAPFSEKHMMMNAGSKGSVKSSNPVAASPSVPAPTLPLEARHSVNDDKLKQPKPHRLTALTEDNIQRLEMEMARNPVVGQTTSPAQDDLGEEESYDKEEMKKLEGMLAFLMSEDDKDNAVLPGKGQLPPSVTEDELQPRTIPSYVSPPPAVTPQRNTVLRNGALSPPATETGTQQGNDDGVVRMTLAVYNTVLQDRDKLQAEIARLRKGRDQGETVLKTEMESKIAQKDQIIQQLSASLANIPTLEGRIQELEAKLSEQRSTEKHVHHTEQQRVAKLLADKELEIVLLQKTMDIVVQQKDGEIEEHKAALDELNCSLPKAEQEKPSQHTSDELLRAQREIKEKEKQIQELKETVAAEQSMRTLLSEQLQSLPTAKAHFAKLQEDLKAKTSEASRLRNELREATKLLERKEAIIKRTSNESGLRGGAHLVQPSPQARLPKQVLACMNCYVKNLPCDHSITCHNCRGANRKCLRFRCSMQHVLKNCPDKPFCKLTHSNEGWLVTDHERPEW